MSDAVKGISLIVLVLGAFVGLIIFICHFASQEPGFTHEVQVLSPEHVVVKSVDDWFGGTTVTSYWLLHQNWTDDDGDRLGEKSAVSYAINKAVRRYEIKSRDWVETKD